MRRRCASGCGETADLNAKCQFLFPSLLSYLPWSGSRISNNVLRGVITYRNACRACASCYGAFRNWKYPSLYRSQFRGSW
jgi:hypothetical protein